MRHAVVAFVLLVLLHRFVGCCTGNELVRETALVVGLLIIVSVLAVDLTVGVLSIIWRMQSLLAW